MATTEDQSQMIYLELTRHKVIARKVRSSCLVIVLAKNKDPALYEPAIAKAVDILGKGKPKVTLLMKPTMLQCSQ